MRIMYYLIVWKSEQNNLKEKENIMKFNEYVKNKIRKRNLENLDAVRLSALDHLEDGTELPGYLEAKIRKRCRKYGWAFYQVLSAAITDPVAASTLAKQAKRQGVAEIAQQEFLEHRGITVNKLSNIGPDSIRLLDGELIYGSGSLDIRATKSMDFICQGNDLMDLIYAKYTEESGGAQDNQAQDVLRFLEEATAYVNTHDDKVRFVALLDGGYYFKIMHKFNRYATDRIIIANSDTYYGTTTITTSGSRKQKARDSFISKELVDRVKHAVEKLAHRE